MYICTGHQQEPDTIERKPVQVRELRDNLAAYLKQAEEGMELIVMSRDRAVARLGPPPSSGNKRKLGLLAGRIWIAPDFDDTPEELIDAMEGGRER